MPTLIQEEHAPGCPCITCEFVRHRKAITVLQQRFEQSERDHEKTIGERDHWETKATELADDIGKALGIEVGEHSNANCPVQNAIDGVYQMTGAIQQALKAAEQLSELTAKNSELSTTLTETQRELEATRAATETDISTRQLSDLREAVRRERETRTAVAEARRRSDSWAEISDTPPPYAPIREAKTVHNEAYDALTALVEAEGAGDG